MAKPLTNEEWWHKRFRMLEAQAEPLLEIEPDEVYDKNGLWPAIKLISMKYALGFYGPVMAKQVQDGNWDSLHFIDLCAGSGLTRLNSKQRDQKVVVTGSAIIGAMEDKFDHYHFVEPRKTSAQALEKRLATLLPEDQYTVHNMKRADAIPVIASDIKESSRSPHYLAFVDPEGFTEITLPDLQPFFDLGRGDFMFNYQHLGAKRAPEHATAFFGSDEWPKDGSPDDITQFFFERLKHYGRPAITSIDVIAGKGSGPYAYKMVYAAPKTASMNPWLQNLKKELDRRLHGMDGANLDRMILGGQRTLF